MLMVLAMCLSLLPASTLAATLSDGSTTNTLGNGAYSITLKNDCAAAVKYSVTLNGAENEVTLNGGETLTLKGNANETYSVTWLGGASEDYSYTEPETKEKSGRFWQAANLYDGFDGADGKTYSNTQASNATLTCNHNGLTYSPDFYYLTGVEGSVITFYSEGRKWNGYFYVRESDGESYSGGFTGGRAEARNEALEANGIDPNSEGRYHNYEKDDNNVAMWVYWKATPYISFTSTAEQTQDITGDFTVAALNVDGMPQKVDVTVIGINATSINLNDDGPQADGSALIGKYIEDSKIDFLALSESFNYYSQINSNAPSYATGTQRLPEGLPTSVRVINALQIKFPFDTDGLNLMYNKKLTVGSESMTAWTEHYSPDDESIPFIDVPSTHGADGMIDKGYRFYQVKVADGVVVDVYILHMDADSSDDDNAARAKQIDQLMQAVEANDNGNPIIIMGDTNCRYTRDPLEQKIIKEGGFSDPWIDLKKGGTCPKVGEEALMVGELGYEQGEVVDKVFYKNAEGSNLTIKAVSYDVDADGYVYPGTETMLGDHPPVIVKFEYTLKSNTTQHTHQWATTWSHDDNYHWHECTAAGCDISSNVSKGAYGPHDFVASDFTAATCTTDGSQTLTCECGYTKTEVIPATGHNLDEGTITTAPTAGQPGVKTYHCTNPGCNYTYTKTIPATGQFNYTFVVDFPEEHYDVGDTVTADIYIKSNDEGANFMTVDFTLAVPEGLTLSNLESALPAGTVSDKDGQYAYNINSTNPVTVTSAGVKIATATFTVDADEVGDSTPATLNLSVAEVTNNSTAEAIPGAVQAGSTTLHNIKVTLNPGEHGLIMGTENPLTLYAKYNESGLYAHENRTGSPVGDINVSADTGYRVADVQWSDNMKSFSHIAVQQFTESKEYTLQTVKTWNITFEAGTNVTFTGNAQTVVVTVDDGTLFSKVDKPEYTLPNNNYTFDGWFNGDTLMTDNTLITGDLTLTAKASAKQVTFSSEAEHATVHVTDGVTGNQATYGTPITFTVTPVGQYVIDSVTYTVNGENPQPLSAQGGTYTIPGDKITGDIRVEVVMAEYHTVTFEAGTGVNMTEATAYVMHNGSTLYTDSTFKTMFTVPTPAAQNGYRLADPVWLSSDGKSYTTAGLSSAVFTADTTLTAQAIQQWTVTFQAGDHGTFSSTSVVVDDNTTVPIDKIPTVTAEPGYKFTGWSGDVNAAITADTTFTAQYTDDSYTLTLPDTNGVSFKVDGATLKDGVYTVTHGTDVTITMNVTGNVKVTELSYQIGSNSEVTVADNDGGITSKEFDIDGENITGAIFVTIKSTETYQITVTVEGGNGKVNGNTESATVTVDKGTTAEKLASMFTFEPNPGYKVDAITPAFDTVNGNATYTVTFTDASYRVTWPANENGALPETLTHGKDFIFTPSVTGKLVTGVTYQVGENQVALEPNADGSYTIPGSAITGPITVTYTTVDATWEFISEGDYKAAPVGEKVAILKTSKLGTGTYTLTGYGDMYWSEKYDNGAYVCFVDDDETAATLTQKLATNSNTVIEINYDGKINSDDKVSAADSAPITAVLHQIEVQYDITDLMRFQFDVNGDKAVTTQDIEWILDEAVGNSHTSSNT